MIKFVYFDIGGVVITDFSGNSKWQELKRDIGVQPEQDEKVDEFFDRYESELCVGRNIETLIPLLETKFGLNFPKNYSLLSNFVDRFEKNKHIWPTIAKAKSKYKIGLLTNMYPGLLDIIKQNKLLPSVEWDEIVDSSIEKVCKPQKEIYELAEMRAGVKANEILFVENSKVHIDAARRLGWQTFLYDSSDKEKASKELELTLK